LETLSEIEGTRESFPNALFEKAVVGNEGA